MCCTENQIWWRFGDGMNSPWHLMKPNGQNPLEPWVCWYWVARVSSPAMNLQGRAFPQKHQNNDFLSVTEYFVKNETWKSCRDWEILHNQQCFAVGWNEESHKICGSLLHMPSLFAKSDRDVKTRKLSPGTMVLSWTKLYIFLGLFSLPQDNLTGRYNYKKPVQSIKSVSWDVMHEQALLSYEIKFSGCKFKARIEIQV